MNPFDLLPDEMIIEIAKTMDYPRLVEIWGTNVRNKRLLKELLPIKFAEYVRSNMKYISAGDYYTAFINNRGQLYVMGRNTEGQLGLGHKFNTITPTPVESFKVVAVSAGAYHATFITDQGQMYTMGDNKYGQLGIGALGDTSVPMQVKIFMTNDQLEDEFLPVQAEKFKVVAISAGTFHTAFITDQGKLFTMGDNGNGQLGLGDIGDTNYVELPTQVGNFRVKSVSAGGFHTAFITDQGQLYVMGYNDGGQLGIGDKDDVNLPTPVVMESTEVIAVSCGYFHTAFITEQGRLYVMGGNEYGQLGLGHRNAAIIPTAVGTYKVAAVSAGDLHTAFITDRGQLYVMGRNNLGQLGLGHTNDILSPTPVKGFKVIAVSAGDSHTVFITYQGQIYVMGDYGVGSSVPDYKNIVSTPIPIRI